MPLCEKPPRTRYRLICTVYFFYSLLIVRPLGVAAKGRSCRRQRPFQVLWYRRFRASYTNMVCRIYLEPSDVRGKLMARRAGSLLIFAVDASGSMALNRMNAAKGAACSLLAEAYKSRDKICLIPFQGQTADVLLPPTRSIALAKNRSPFLYPPLYILLSFKLLYLGWI